MGLFTVAFRLMPNVVFGFILYIVRNSAHDDWRCDSWDSSMPIVGRRCFLTVQFECKKHHRIRKQNKGTFLHELEWSAVGSVFVKRQKSWN